MYKFFLDKVRLVYLRIDIRSKCLYLSTPILFTKWGDVWRGWGTLADIIVQFEHFYFAPFLNPFCVTPSKIVVYNRWKMRTKTITIQQLLPGLAWGEMSVEIALPTVYSSCECLSPCWCHFSLQDLPRKECQFCYCTDHETVSLLNGNQTRWHLFSFDFWIWKEGLLIGWI